MFAQICKVFFTVLLFICTENEAARILVVIPTPSISHQVVFRPLFHELAIRGHDVTIVTTDPAFDKGNVPENITEIDLHKISYESFRTIFYNDAIGKKNSLITQFSGIFECYNNLFELQVKSDRFQEILKKPKYYYDLIFLEACYRHFMVLSHVFKAPLVLLSSMGPVFDNLKAIGALEHPILNWPVHRQRLYNLTFWDKLNELYVHYMLKNIIYNNIKHEDQLLKKIFGPDVPSVLELNNNIDMLFLNSNPITEGNQPLPLNVVQLYGIHRKSDKELPSELKNYLDNSSHGVIYMSFGTNADPSVLPQEIIQIFVNVFAKLPYNILWKWNLDEVPSNASNIRFGKWFPQSDLLRHPNVKLFITQGGLQSTEESINVGVPLIGIPLIADQWLNTEKYKMFNIGEKLDLETIDEDILRNNINKVIGDESYRKNIGKLRNLLTDEKESPLERAIWWTEYVIRHKGAKHLRSPYANISWWDYLELDFLFKLLTLVISIIILISCIFYYLFRCIRLSLMRYFYNKSKNNYSMSFILQAFWATPQTLKGSYVKGTPKCPF